MAAFSIRTSNPTDEPRLGEIWESAVLATHDFLTLPDFREIRELVLRSYLPGSSVWCLEAEGAGLIAWMDLDAEAGHVHALFVDPPWHGKGAGRALVRHAVSLLGRLTVDVNEQNAQAVGFYRRLGFETVGRSDRDPDGRLYPILHMAREGHG